MGRMTRQQSIFRLENDPLLVCSADPIFAGCGLAFGLWGDTERNRISVALEEALANALYHGNLEVASELRERDPRSMSGTIDVRRGQSPYRERHIEVEAEFSAKRAVFVIRDEARLRPHDLARSYRPGQPDEALRPRYPADAGVHG